jgi:glycosyltransferase involved in cell wall biosynthesis
MGAERPRILTLNTPVSRKTPKISIGLPVYNGEAYLSEAIDCLREQTYSDFEIIVCDNASSDNTERICKHYAGLDDRIRYQRNTRNIGAAGNFNLTFTLSRGEYFKWAAHDDLLGKDYLLRCLERLEQNPSVVLCHTAAQYIDEAGRHIPNPPAPVPDARSSLPNVRFAQLIDMRHWCLDIFGLIRRSSLEKTPLISDYIGSDRNTLASLTLMGQFDRVPERLFFTRDHRERSVRKIPLHERNAWFNPEQKKRITFPHWRVFAEYIKTVQRAEIPSQEKLLCGRHLFLWLFRSRLRLRKDCRMALKQFLINNDIDYAKYRFWKRLRNRG